MAPAGSKRVVSAASTAWTNPPDKSELEVTLFGPGYGECVAVHLGDGEWILVDSCIAHGHMARLGAVGPPSLPPQAHPALGYLIGLGVDLRDVTNVIATHWHDDHVRGLDHLVAHCQQAELVISPVLSQDELVSGLCQAKPLTDQRATNGVDTMRRALVLADSQERLSVHMEGVNLVARSGARVTFLAPSGSSYVRGQRELGRLLTEQRQEGRTRVRAPRRNDSSIVLWIDGPGAVHARAGPVSALLGGDLEVVAHPRQGWKGVYTSRFRQQAGRASLVKVAHHGSANGQHSPVWRDMTNAPVALLTPWDRGPGLPSAAGLAIIRAHASTVISTASLPVRPKRRNGQVRATISLGGGRVTARAVSPSSREESPPSGQEWRLHLVPPALQI